MDTKQIEKYLTIIDPSIQYNVFAANRIPVYFTPPVYLISNLDPDTKPGSHWVAIYIDSKGIGEYFDSFGRKPTGSHEVFLKTNCKKWIYNNIVLQNYFSSYCGIYCLVYIYLKFNHVSMSQFIRMFCNNTLYNDQLVHNMFNFLFKGLNKI